MFQSTILAELMEVIIKSAGRATSFEKDVAKEGVLKKVFINGVLKHFVGNGCRISLLQAKRQCQICFSATWISETSTEARHRKGYRSVKKKSESLTSSKDAAGTSERRQGTGNTMVRNV